MAYYANAAGQMFLLPERPIEPPDCWVDEVNEEDEDDDPV